MRTVKESGRAVIVDIPGRVNLMIFLFGLVPVCAIHFRILFPFIQDMISSRQLAIAMMSIVSSSFVYPFVAYILLVRNPDRKIITFHGYRALVRVERHLAFNYKVIRDIKFAHFEQIEISPHDDMAFCRLRMKDGSARNLFRVESLEEYQILERLEGMIGKKVAVILKSPYSN